jgi:hypothetical protein
MSSDLHVAAARLIELEDAPETINDRSLAVEAVREALAAEDVAGGPVTTPAPEPVAVPEPVAEVAPEAVSASVEPAAPEPAPVDPAPVADPAHDAAVAAVAPVVAAVVSPPEPVTLDVHATALATAQTDLAAALAQWPDSPQLQDLKTQLDALGS